MASFVARHPRWSTGGKVLLALVLLGLVTFEGVVLARQPNVPHAVVWASGLAVCPLVVPYARVPLAVRASLAAAISWTATIILIVGNHPTAVWGIGEAVALLVLLADVLSHAATRTAAILGPLLGTACMSVPVRDTDPGRFTLLFTVLTVVVSAYSLMLRAHAAQRVRDIEAVRAAERLELARELHDVVAHHVTGVVVQAQAAQYTSLQGEAAGSAFRRIEDEGIEALGAMRRLVAVMRDRRGQGREPAEVEMAPVAGIGEVRELADAFARSGPPVILSIEPGLEERLPEEIAAAVHRIVREALTNIRKHAADATAVRVDVRGVGDAVELRVADDGTSGVPVAEEAGGGFGLVGMSERAEAMGGHLRAGPSPAGGWQVEALLPLTRPR
ncbi:sensor histidine kinase [Streptomyces pathocidini]|uniref:histidine kinase n=1 Tax=Streptomyces pathocidini TaxID=1650571 RepID=A0ABW7UVI3_9ACTN|nr:histidine kinase [Streptomyces pathocidini]